MAHTEATDDPLFLTPLGLGVVSKVVYEQRPGGLLSPPHYHEAPSLDDVPSGATVHSVSVEVPQISTDGEPADSVIWTETCP